MAKLLKLLLLVFFSLNLIPKYFSSTVLAQVAGKSFTVIPPRFELFANPGEILTERVRIRNDSPLPITYNVLIEDFSTAGEEGHVVLEEDSKDITFSMAKWMTAESDVITLNSNEEKVFSFTIKVPTGAEPGGHYASLLFSSGADPQPGSATITQRVGALILLRVSGNITEDSLIETFEAPKYSPNGPITFTLRVKNNGNVHIQPKGTIIITNFLGQKVDELPLNGANVMPNATRKMETVWDKKSIIGSFTATMVATYGQQNLPLTSATKFTVISTTAAIILIIGLIALILFLLGLISGRKRLKKALKILASGQ